MSGTDIGDRRLVELYHRYVGEPASRRDVYGYWIFVVGSIVGLLGVLTYQLEQALFPANLAIREIAIVLAATGLPIALLGIVVLLPVRRRGMQASVLGLLISLVAVGLFVQVYPRAWYVGPDFSAEIIAIYTLGIAILAAVAMLVPVLTGEKGLLVEPEFGIGDDHPPLLVGDANRDAFFAVYKLASREWTWRLIEREAIGESAQIAPSDTDARIMVESVRSQIGEAGFLEITTAAFRLYRTDDGGWRWTLVREDGSVIARNAEEMPDRQGIEESVNFLKEEGPTAGLLDIRSAAFHVYESDDRWYWRLLDPQRSVLARTVGSFRHEADAEKAAAAFTEILDDARILSIETVALELFDADSNSGWRWRFVDPDDRPLVTSEATFDTRRGAEQAATAAADRIQDAPRIESNTAAFEVYERDGQWHWRLRGDTDTHVAHGSTDWDDRSAIEAAARRAREAIPAAETVEYTDLDFEAHPMGGGWGWRLVREDRAVVAESVESASDRDGAVVDAEAVRTEAGRADLIEFEHAAFQQYEIDGEWRWRLIDEAGRVMTDSGEEYGSKSDARDAMTTLKEHAPNAEVLEIETSAFEIFRREQGTFGWRLIDDGGQLIAAGARAHDSRRAARREVEAVRETAGETSVRAMESPIFQRFRDEMDDWRWRLVHPDGSVLAEAPRALGTRDEIDEAIDRVRAAGTGADIEPVGPMTVQLRSNGDWHWRLIDIDHEPVATGSRRYEDREQAVADIDAVTGAAATAPIFALGDGVVWIDREDDGWRWRLLDGERSVVATGGMTFESRDETVESVEMTRARAPDADRIEFEGAMFELYRLDAGEWRWRLLDDDENVMASSAVAIEQRSDAESILHEVREVVPDASIIETDDAAFELHRRGSGWIWRLVDENGRALVESVTIHPDRRAARDEMNEIKASASRAEITVTR